VAPPRWAEGFTAWGAYISGRYVELEKEKRVVQELKTTEWPEGYPPSMVELKFKPMGMKTQLTMVHTKVPAEQSESYTEGWHESYWEPMKRFFAKS
jgi:activator of HSP90 ATPase